jgi:hypothetical protein
MSATTIKAGYVVTADGTILVQVPSPASRFGFYLCDDEQSWDGGIGVAQSWTLIADDDPRIDAGDRERLGWILEDARL